MERLEHGILRIIYTRIFVTDYKKNSVVIRNIACHWEDYLSTCHLLSLR